MFLHFHRGRKRGKREIVKPCFFVLRRRTLTFGAALLMAVAIFGAVNAPAAVRASAATRQLPIYCVERDQKVCSISFDPQICFLHRSEFACNGKSYGLQSLLFSPV